MGHGEHGLGANIISQLVELPTVKPNTMTPGALINNDHMGDLLLHGRCIHRAEADILICRVKNELQFARAAVANRSPRFLIAGSLPTAVALGGKYSHKILSLLVYRNVLTLLNHRDRAAPGTWIKSAPFKRIHTPTLTIAVG
jgi:hypothetical protein